MKVRIYMGPAIAAALAILLASTPLHADRILVIGDSWAGPVAPQLQTVLHENGYTEITVEATPFIYTALEMSSPEKLNDITTWLDERPDVTIVQMSIGENDRGENSWTVFWAGTKDEKRLIETIISNVEITVDHILEARPDIRILWSSYDFPRPLLGIAPTQINTWLITLAEQMAQFAMAKPGLSFVDINGALQVAYGFDGVRHTRYDPSWIIPPGDPSLPDLRFPSPLEPFLPNDRWHLLPGGYKTLAQAQYDGYYASVLADAGENFPMNAGLNGNWWKGPDRNGEGIQVEVSDGGDGSLVFVATIYSYDTMGRQIFLIAVGTVKEDTAEVEVYITDGGLWGNAYDPALVNESRWGTGIFTASSCDSMSMELKPNAEFRALGYTDLVYDLIRLTTTALPCPTD